MTKVYALLFCSLLTIAAAPAFAQDDIAVREDEEARQLFDAARLAYQAGRFDEALERFTRAHELSGRPVLLFNIAQAHDRLDHDEEALATFERYIEQVPDAENREYCEGRIRALREHIASQAASTHVDGPVEAIQVPTEHTSAAPTVEDSDEGPNLVVPIVLYGVAGALAVTSVITGASALSIHGELEDDCPEGRCDPSLRDRADEMQTLAGLTDVLVIGAVGLAITGTILLILELGDDEEEAPPSVACGLGGCAGTF